MSTFSECSHDGDGAGSRDDGTRVSAAQLSGKRPCRHGGGYFVVMVPLTLLVTAISAVLWFASSKLLPRPMDRTEKNLSIASVKARSGRGARARTVSYHAGICGEGVLRGKGSELFRRALDDAPTLRQDFRRITRMFS